MNSKIIATTLALAFGSALSNAECTGPEVPSLPAGDSATMEQMIAGQGAVKSFQATNIEYMSCLEKLFTEAAAVVKDASGDAQDAAQASYDTAEAAYNNAVSKEEEVADAFNTAIRAFKAANPS
ncbi:MAG: hypothetical protein ACI9DH_001353 [Halioglobus sp.]|jgi:hypothetical protein